MKILTPLLAYDFKIDLMGNQTFNDSVEDFSFDVLRKQLALTVRESVDCSIMPVVLRMPDMNNLTMTWEGTTRAGTAVMRLFFHGLKLSDHSFAQAYTESRGCAKHILQFTYETVDTE